ncbi:hypothetical protein [Saccharospirillum mangrovi]|uniref:hypothetical protein n=1 Tax=Saccharospirillum mangrovi TaxID=2161747 RepID=UPI000D362190|nr:hypothetical protein [Saccharospirillum mangrovi]
MRSIITSSAITLGVFSLIGCAETDSENVTTKGTGAYFTVQADGDGTATVSGRLTAGTGLAPTQLVLSGDDRLFASDSRTRSSMRQSSSLLDGDYYARFDNDDSLTEFTIDYQRAIDVDAHLSVLLPEQFDITHPSNNQSVNNSQVELEWSPHFNSSSASRTMDLKVSMKCVDQDHDEFSVGRPISVKDTGSYTIKLSNYVDVDINSLRHCYVDVELERSKRGDVDSKLAGGYFIATQSREVSFIFDLVD